MSQNGQTHFKNVAAFKVCLTIFGTLCIKGLRVLIMSFISSIVISWKVKDEIFFDFIMSLIFAMLGLH